MAEVPVNGKVLKWARELRGLDLETAAGRLAISENDLQAYEAGQKKPLIGLLKKMSSKYRINFASLLMPEPLREETPPTDHRTRLKKKKLSFPTLVAIEEIREALEAFEDISSASRSIVPRPNLGFAKLEENPEEVAARERRKFGVSSELQRSWGTQSKARLEWRLRIERQGIFTYMIGLPLSELSGFSLFQDGLAAICVNDNEFPEGAKTFTLFHEYCHLLLRNTGISDEDNKNQVERFCNRFAASFLIPKVNLKQAIATCFGEVNFPYEFSDTEIKCLSRAFHVSNRAMALRLQETGFAPDGFYEKRTAPWDRPAEVRVETRKKTQVSPIRKRIKRLGNLHTATVLHAVGKKAINSFDASLLVGLRPEFFPKLAANLR
jgi:Zn-dependent peptidase ImmA (M78 family)